MPFINSKVTVKMDDSKKETMKKELGNLIALIPGKTESWLMVGFEDNYTLYFKGEKKEKAAFVEVKIFGAVDRSDKNNLTAEICDLFEKELQIPKDSIYVTIQEINDWGWNGSLF